MFHRKRKSEGSSQSKEKKEKTICVQTEEKRMAQNVGRRRKQQRVITTSVEES